ncbi:MAG: MmgE/PrpD family protein [Candidatus Brocadiaceae bacterium]|nr:MmgE/PrpD family protein [Candidatus Brocadiaceae bacterium]
MTTEPAGAWERLNPGMFDETPGTVGRHTRDVAAFVSRVDYDDLPAGVVTDTKHLILDTISCALTGRDVASARITREVSNYLGGGAQASVIGTRDRTSPPLAAMVNAKMANAIDLDDCFMNIAHFAPQATMAPLALGESLHRSGREVIVAVAAGYEVAARIALAANFWKVTGQLVYGGGSERLVFGANVFGAAAAAVKALGLDEQAAATALGVCGYFAPSLIRSSESALEPPTYGDAGYMAKYCDAGWSTFTGVMSAVYAKTGFVANRHSLDGRHGYMRIMGGEGVNEDMLTHGLARDQEHWCVSDSALKTHPCCKYVHTPLHLFLELVEENGLRVEDIERVTVHLRPSHAMGFADQTVQVMQGIPCTHNIPYNLAMAAFGMTPTHEWHAEGNADDPKVRAFMRKVFTQPSGEAPRTGVEDIRACGFPKRIFSQVDVQCAGKAFSKSADRVKGDPWWEETKFTDRDRFDKLTRCAAGTLGRERTEAVWECIMGLEDTADVAALAELLRP